MSRTISVISSAVGLALIASSLGIASAAQADHHSETMAAPVSVGGAAMYPNRTIVQNAVNSPIHHTLVAAVQAAGLVDTLNSAGPFTVFAPTDEAFGHVPEATRTFLMQPTNRAILTKVLTYHVIAGRITAAQLVEQIQSGNGIATLTTVEGETLTATLDGTRVRITGKNGSVAFVSQADVMQSNGVIHVVDGVLTPTL